MQTECNYLIARLMSDQITIEELSKYVKNVSQKHEAFTRNGFVLPNKKSSIINNEYLEYVSLTLMRPILGENSWQKQLLFVFYVVITLLF